MIIIHFNDKIENNTIVYAQRQFISIVFIIRKTKKETTYMYKSRRIEK